MKTSRRTLGQLVGEMGGGRFTMDDTIDPSVGLRLLKRRGDRVSRGETIAEIHASSEQAASACTAKLVLAIQIGSEWPSGSTLILS